MKIIDYFLYEAQNDFKVGDMILTGKFKNRKSLVKGFGKDKNNQPTVITDRGELSLYKFRIKKLMTEIKINDVDMTRYEKMYDKFDKAHDKKHMKQVYDTSVFLAKKYLPDQIKLVKIAATLHDIGLLKGRENHELNGYKMIMNDNYLKKFLSDSEIKLIAQAVREHRASSGNPQTILAKIISDADRSSSNTKEAIKRSYEYQKHYYPNISNEDALKLAFEHLATKYAKNSYGRRCYFPETRKKLADIYDPICKLYKKNDFESFKILMENQQIKKIKFENNIIPWDGFIYHYLFNDKQVNKILKTGKLLPIDKVLDKEKIKDYSERALKYKFHGASKKNTDLENAQIWWKQIYEEKYKPITKKPYLNYGIYLTPLDLFQFNNELKYRFRFNVYDLLKRSPNIVIQIGAKSWPVKTESSIEKVMNYFQDYNKIEHIWNSSKVKFIRLPQVVTFADFLPVSKKNLEVRK